MKYQGIMCDGCGDFGTESEGQYSMTIGQMREKLKQEGWRTGWKGGTDYCPTCKKIIKKEGGFK